MDHVVVLVRDLDRAVGDYGRLGFAVTPGGEHADGLTRNALVPFKDGSYLELVAFLDPDDPRDNVWGWRPFVGLGGGLIDHCLASDDLSADAKRLEGGGLALDGPDAGGRRLPDGVEIRWRSARIRQGSGRALPFLIEDLTPRGSRVPGGSAVEHPNGATGIARLEVAVPDPARAARFYGLLIDRETEPEARSAPSREYNGGASFGVGPCEVALVSPESTGDARDRFDAMGAGPFGVVLAGGEGAELDRRLAHGVRIGTGRLPGPGR